MSTNSNRMADSCLRWSLACLVIIGGCGKPYQVQPQVAVNTLKAALDSWKNGKTPDSLKDAKPPIIVQDMDWMGGAKLIAFEIQDEGKPVDANLYAKVKLKLHDSTGAESEKIVTYCVGTGPSLTVFRDMLH